MSPIATQVSFLRALKGAPASILMTLLLTGRAYSKRELQLLTGYSDKPISEGLALLKMAGVVGQRVDGWLLTARPEELAQLITGEPAGDSHRASQTLSTGRNISDPPSTTTDSQSAKGDNDPVAVSTYSPDPELTGPPPSVDNPASWVGNPAGSVDNFADSVDNEDARRAAMADNQSEVRAWLERAGVGSRSPKMQKLLAARLSARYVQAHVLEREYHLRWRLMKPNEYRVGLLIRRLEDGDPAPPMRCPVCLDETPCRC